MIQPLRQQTVDQPDLSESDVIDITRVLQAFTDAFIVHHQHAPQCQQRAEQQLALFEAIDEDIRSPYKFEQQQRRK